MIVGTPMGLRVSPTQKNFAFPREDFSCVSNGHSEHPFLPAPRSLGNLLLLDGIIAMQDEMPLVVRVELRG